MILTKKENKVLLDLLDEERIKMAVALENTEYASLSPNKVKRQRVVCEIIRKLKGWV